MKPRAYYNEFDPKAAATLRELIKQGQIADGEVDSRSIEDVHPIELRGFTQCHFFAGFGVWSYALRLAGWPDDRRVWTASCPCQPFSAAGAGAGFADERHLWPALYHLVCELRPGIVLGEQVASKDADPWVDLVQDDMEALGYAFGAIAFPSAGVGAPHIRDRTYWVADSNGKRPREFAEALHAGQSKSGGRGVTGGLADTDGGHAGAEREQRSREQRQLAQDRGAVGFVVDANSARPQGWSGVRRADQCAAGAHGVAGSLADDDDAGRGAEPSLRLQRPDFHDADGRRPVGGFWSDADWIACRDDKWRPVEPGTFPLAHGAAERVGRLRGYGNAINAEAAKAFVESYLESELA